MSKYQNERMSTWPNNKMNKYQNECQISECSNDVINERILKRAHFKMSEFKNERTSKWANVKMNVKMSYNEKISECQNKWISKWANVKLSLSRNN